MPFGNPRNLYLPGYGFARKPRPDIEPRGTHRQRSRRKVEVDGPYRSQSSNPSIRSKATRHEHRKAAPAPPPRPPSLHAALSILKAPPPSAPQAELNALLHGTQPDPHGFYTPAEKKRIESAQLKYLSAHENLGEPEDLTNAILAVTAAGDVASLLKGAGTIGARAVGATAAKEAAGTGEANALIKALTGIGRKEGGAAARVAQVARGGVVRRAVGRAAAKAEPAAVRAAREGVAGRAAQVAERIPRPLRVAGGVTGRAASAPIRHPFTAPLAIQTPAALIHRDPGEYMKALEGKGTLASIAGLGQHVAPIVGEAASLPAAVLPSVFLTGRAGVNALKGNSKELSELVKQWEKTGLLPHLAKGDTAGALKALGEHPLYSGLEASGAASVLGRGAGAIAREATGGRVGGLERPDLPIRGTSISLKRRYSRDLLRQGLQRAFDQTRAGREVAPDTFRGRHYLKEAANRFEAGQEMIRKAHIHEDMQALKKTLPKKWRRIDRQSAEVVNLAVERILRHPETFNTDLPLYRDMLEKAAGQLRPDGKPLLDRSQMAANKALRKQIDAALKGGNPEHVVHSANAFIELQQPLLEEMVDLKLLSPEQAASASATSFARVHMGAGYEEGIGKVDSSGNPLSLDAIKAEMKRHGIEAPGFLSHRAPTPGDFYRPSFGGAMLDKGVRTGESVATGSQLGGVEALVRQLRRSRGLVDRAKSWNEAVTRFGIEVPGVETWADAKRVLRDPQRYGLDPGTQPVAVPRHPFMAKKDEILGALEHQSPSIAGETASGVLSGALSDAMKGNLEDSTPVVFMPGKVAEQLRSGAEPAGAGLRGAQAATTLFTRTVLPFSPGWYLGNGLDNTLRTIFAGINPTHFLVGERVRRELTPEQRAELLAGAHYSSVSTLNPHRNVEALVRGYDPLSKTIRAAAEWSRRRGWAQTAVKFAPQLLSHSSNALIAVNKFLTEDLPQRGALGKLAAAELRNTQGSWSKALLHQRELAQDFAKKVVDPNKMIQFQKDLEEVYGNYSRMSPAARKVLRNVSPFWAWFRAAYKFVYVTMPAHHPIATGALTAAARATQPEREKYGLDKEGERPLPSYMQGSIPLRGGGIFPAASYSSFGYASDPLEAVNKLVLPQYRSIVEALAGRDWKGDELKGGESGKVLGALWSFATAFVPGAPLLADESESHKRFAPHLNLPHAYPPDYVQYKRTPTQKITVPVRGESSSGGVDYGNVFSGGGGSGVDYGAVFSGQ